MRDIYSAAPIRAHAYLMPFDFYQTGAWLVTGIDVARTERGNGVARSLAARVLADADTEGVTLCLNVEPDGSAGSLSEQQLRDWYARLGFVTAPDPLAAETGMVREPRA